VTILKVQTLAKSKAFSLKQLNQRRSDMRRAALLFLITSLCLLLPNCGGDHKTLQTNPVGGYIGRLGLLVQWPFADDIKAQLTADDLSKLAAAGVTIQNGMAMLPEQTASGCWVDINGKRYMVGVDGFVHIPSLPPGTHDDATVPVYRQLTDTRPLGSFPLNQLVFTGQTATPVTLRLNLPDPGNMNPDGDLPPGSREAYKKTRVTLPFTAGCAIRGNFTAGLCAPGNNAAPGCCVDYDGAGGDGRALVRGAANACDAQAVLNFTGSTCALWVARGVCALEGAFIPGFPSCWRNHKFRNCQNLVLGPGGVIIMGAAGAAEGGDVEEGEKVGLSIHNASPDNETAVSFVSAGAGGALTGPVEAGYGGYLVRHYNDSSEVHLVDRQITYEAPAHLPVGVTVATDVLEFDAGGYTTIITFRVHPKTGSSGGTP
jgi:hypothetical protein